MALNYKKSFKNLISNIKRFFTGSKPQPKEDWVFMTVLFFLFLIVLIIVNVYIFLNQNYFQEKEFISEEISEDVDSLNKGIDINKNKEELEKVKKYFKEKEERLIEIQDILKEKNKSEEKDVDEEETESVDEEKEETEIPESFFE